MTMGSLFLLSFLLLGCVSADPWNTQNNPRVFSKNFTYAFAHLPLKGETATLPWSDTCA